MTKKIKLGRNDLCPCGTGNKFKNCCSNKKDWDTILTKNIPTISENLTLRGKNILFYNLLVDALELKNKDNIDIKTIKKACTPKAVQKIHSAVLAVWPHEKDLQRILKSEADNDAALYIGHYEPAAMIRGITRHSLYSKKIFVVDTFTDPRMVRPEFNPLEHPDKYLETTLKDLRLWFTLFPWIEAGIVNFIKNPCDFDAKLNYECMMTSQKRFDENPDMEKYIDDVPEEALEEMKEWHLISYPDSRIREMLKEFKKDISPEEIENVVSMVHVKRDNHPYFVPFINEDKKQFRDSYLAIKSGANFEMAKLIASSINSSLITDMAFRWEEIEMDHSNFMIKQEHWNSFSKAFQEIGISFLNNSNIDYALKIRKQNYLSEIRDFLSRIWRDCMSDNLFDEKNIKILEEELRHHLKEAEIEWGNIEKKFFKNFGTAASAIVSSYPIIAKGSAEYLIGSLGINGLTNLGVMWHEKHNFTKKYPASFFLKMGK